MNKKLGFTLAGTGFLLVNGIAIPSLGNSFSFSNFSTNDLFSGGGISSLINLSSANKRKSSIKLETTKLPKQFNLETSQLSETKLSLEVPSAEGVSLQPLSLGNKGEVSVTSSIQEIRSSIETEAQVQSVADQTQSQYKDLLSKKMGESPKQIQEYLKSFGEVKTKLGGHSRGRRSSSTSSISYLSKDHRVALAKMFSFHHSVKKTSGSLSQDLRNKAGEGMELASYSAGETSVNVSAVEQALKEIGWEGDYLKGHRSRTVEQFLDSKEWGPRRSQVGNRRRWRGEQFFSSRSWGQWNNNPFRHFYSKEREFIKDIADLKENAINALEALQEQNKSNWRSELWGLSGAQDETLTQKVTSVDSHMAEKIAKFLLSSMGS